MARLIEEDVVLQRFIQESEYSGVNVVHINTIKRILKDIETAYDVERVVEELSKEIKPIIAEKKGFLGISQLVVVGHEIDASRAIKIVRKGGV